MILPLKFLKISGHSMQPTIRDGALVLVNRWAYLFRPPRLGEVVIFRQDNKIFCKRIAALHGGEVIVRGDNKSDTLDISPIPLAAIIGKIIPSP